MVEVGLPEEKRHPKQRIVVLRVEGEVATLNGPALEIRLPARWARKLTPWYQGPGRTILCNADRTTYNLVGVTKAGRDLILSFVDPRGTLAAERTSGHLIEALDRLLGDGKRPGRSR
ncbi:MAG: hypothetical protein ACE5LS_08280 [Thermoplasmata archaeon]